MSRFIILSEKEWNKDIIDVLKQKYPENEYFFINNKEDFNLDNLAEIRPDKIFIPHWSYIIKSDIYDKYECIVFHMTDLPFGRGGSPLQNLIARGIHETKISALRVTKGADTGDIYMKKPLSLYGTAEEIYLRANEVIITMIEDIIANSPQALPQQGEPIVFKRRKPEDSNISELEDLNQVFDYIRMLDAEGYPKAYIDINGYHLEFSRASLKADGSILADVKITVKK